MPHIQFSRLITASMLALPLAFTTFRSPSNAQVIIRGDNFGIRIGGNRSHRRKRHNRFLRQRSFRHHHRRARRRFRRFGNIYRQPKVIYDSPDIIYRRTEVNGSHRRSRIVLEDPEYIVPNRAVIIGPSRRHYRQRRFPTYAPGKYLIPTQRNRKRIFQY